jgi:hypothetical protein
MGVNQEAHIKNDIPIRNKGLALQNRYSQWALNWKGEGAN